MDETSTNAVVELLLKAGFDPTRDVWHNVEVMYPHGRHLISRNRHARRMALTWTAHGRATPGRRRKLPPTLNGTWCSKRRRTDTT